MRRDGVEEWKEYKLGDYCDFQNGYAFKSSEFKTNGEYKIVKIKELKDGLVKFFDDSASVDIHDIKEFEKYKIYRNDVLFALTGDPVSKPNPLSWVGRVSIYRSDENALLNQRTCKIKKSDEIDNQFLYYYFRQWENFYALASKATGSASQANISTNTIVDTIIKLPPLPTQQKIAAILSSLDDKIELNNKINTNLEQQAQALFKNWFVDFEPFGGKMLEGWNVGKLSEIAEITMGQSPDGKSYNEDGIGTVFYQGRAEFGTRFPTRRLFTTEPKRIAKKFDTLMSVRAPVGDTNIANEGCCIGRGLAAIHSKDKHQSFVHYTVLSLRSQLDVFNGEGTVFGCINRDSLNNMEVVIPAKDDLDKLEKIVASLDADIYNRSEENGRLKIIRDTLLPKLMNREIEVFK